MPTPYDRDALLNHEDALDCALYREADDGSDDEIDLGDARILLGQPFIAPEHWDAETRERYYDGLDDDDLIVAWLEPEAAPGEKNAFVPRVGDFLAVTTREARVDMYVIHDRPDVERNAYVVYAVEDEE